MGDPVLRIFSYLPNPRVWKAQIAGELCNVRIEVVGDDPAKLAEWLWDFDARPLSKDERNPDSKLARSGRRGFEGKLFKTDKFLEVHPFGTVPAAFSPRNRPLIGNGLRAHVLAVIAWQVFSTRASALSIELTATGAAPRWSALPPKADIERPCRNVC